MLLLLRLLLVLLLDESSLLRCHAGTEACSARAELPAQIAPRACDSRGSRPLPLRASAMLLGLQSAGSVVTSRSVQSYDNEWPADLLRPTRFESGARQAARVALLLFCRLCAVALRERDARTRRGRRARRGASERGALSAPRGP